LTEFGEDIEIGVVYFKQYVPKTITQILLVELILFYTVSGRRIS